MSSGSDEGTDWTVRPKHENQMVQLKSEKVGFRESDYLKPLERFIKFIGKKRTPPLDSRYIFYAQLDRGMAYKDVYRRKLVCVIMSFSCFDSIQVSDDCGLKHSFKKMYTGYSLVYFLVFNDSSKILVKRKIKFGSQRIHLESSQFSTC